MRVEVLVVTALLVAAGNSKPRPELNSTDLDDGHSKYFINIHKKTTPNSVNVEAKERKLALGFYAQTSNLDDQNTEDVKLSQINSPEDSNLDTPTTKVADLIVGSELDTQSDDNNVGTQVEHIDSGQTVNADNEHLDIDDNNESNSLGILAITSTPQSETHNVVEHDETNISPALENVELTPTTALNTDGGGLGDRFSKSTITTHALNSQIANLKQIKIDREQPLEAFNKLQNWIKLVNGNGKYNNSLQFNPLGDEKFEAPKDGLHTHKIITKIDEDIKSVVSVINKLIHTKNEFDQQRTSISSIIFNKLINYFKKDPPDDGKPPQCMSGMTMSNSNVNSQSNNELDQQIKSNNQVITNMQPLNSDYTDKWYQFLSKKPKNLYGFRDTNATAPQSVDSLGANNVVKKFKKGLIRGILKVVFNVCGFRRCKVSPSSTSSPISYWKQLKSRTKTLLKWLHRVRTAKKELKKLMKFSAKGLKFWKGILEKVYLNTKTSADPLKEESRKTPILYKPKVEDDCGEECNGVKENGIDIPTTESADYSYEDLTPQNHFPQSHDHDPINSPFKPTLNQPINSKPNWWSSIGYLNGINNNQKFSSVLNLSPDYSPLDERPHVHRPMYHDEPAFNNSENQIPNYPSTGFPNQIINNQQQLLSELNLLQQSETLDGKPNIDGPIYDDVPAFINPENPSTGFPNGINNNQKFPLVPHPSFRPHRLHLPGKLHPKRPFHNPIGNPGIIFGPNQLTQLPPHVGRPNAGRSIYSWDSINVNNQHKFEDLIELIADIDNQKVDNAVDGSDGFNKVQHPCASVVVGILYPGANPCGKSPAAGFNKPILSTTGY